MELKQRQKSGLLRLIALAMAVCLLSSAFLERAASAAFSPADIRGAWSERILLEWMNKGWLTGYPDGTVKPKLEVTRAEFFSLANKSLGFVDEAAISFSDVKPGTWKAKQAAIAVQAGYAEGYPDGTMQPDRQITREEVSVMVAKAFDLKLSPEETAVFKDAASISNAGKGAVGALVVNGILKGYLDGTFRPKKVITREEAVAILDGALKKLERGSDKARTFSAAGVYGPADGTETIAGNAVVAASGVTLRNMDIQGDLLLSAGIGEGEAALDNVKVKGTVTANGGGPNSIHLDNSQLESLIVDKKDGNIRIAAKGNTMVKRVDLRSGAKLESGAAKDKGFRTVNLAKEMPAGSKASLQGEFAEANIASSNVELELLGGTIEKLNVLSGASGNTMKLQEDTKIVDLTLEEEANVQGKGTIDRAIVNDQAKDSKFERVPGKLEGGGAPPSSPGPVGGGGGGGGGGNPDTTPPAAPVVTGVQDQGIYAGAVTPNWSDASGTTSTATLTKNGSNKVSYTRNTEIVEDGTYILSVTAVKSSNGMRATTTIQFTIDSVAPAAPRIEGVANGGRYFSVLPDWTDAPNTVSEAMISQHGHGAKPYERGTRLEEEGDYVLTVTARKANGLTAATTVRFSIDSSAAIPAAIEGVEEGGTYSSAIVTWTDVSGMNSTATLAKDGGATAPFNSGTEITEEGDYVLTVTTRNVLSNETVEQQIHFTIDTDLPQPIVTGVADNQIYFEPVTIIWEPSPGTTIAGVSLRNLTTGEVTDNLSSPTTITDDGTYALSVNVERDGAVIPYSYQFVIAGIRGLNDGETYQGVTPDWVEPLGFGSVGKSEAMLSKNGDPAVLYTKGTTIDENGEYELTVTWHTRNENSATQSVNFTIVSPPPTPDISILGTARSIGGVYYHYSATPHWTDPPGTSSTAALKVGDADPVPYVGRKTIEEDGEYELTVTWTDLSTGLTATKSQQFKVNIGAARPILSGIEDKGIYFEPVTISWTPRESTEIASASLTNVNTNERIDDLPNSTAVAEDGEYEFSVEVSRDGEVKQYTYPFIIAGIRDVEDGGVYMSSVTPTWFSQSIFSTRNEMWLTKDGEQVLAYNKGDALSEPGEYVLNIYWLVYQESILQRVHFTIVESVEITGVEHGGTYASAAPTWTDVPGWTSTATLIKDAGESMAYTRGTVIAEDGSYLLTVTTRLDSNGREVQQQISFTIDTVPPGEATIAIGGNSRDLSGVTAYYNATLTWTEPTGTTSTAVLRKDGAEPVPYTMGALIDQDGDYELIVTTTKLSNGATSTATRTFKVDVGPARPVLSGFSDDAVVFNPAEIAWAPGEGTQIEWTSLLHKNNNSTRHNPSNPWTITVAGEYVLTVQVNDGQESVQYAYPFIVAELLGVEEGGAYSRASARWYVPQYFGEVEAELTKDGGSPTPYSMGTMINELGEYVLTVTWRTNAGSSETKSIRFTIVPPPPAPHLTGFSDNAILFGSAEIAWTPSEGTQIESTNLWHRNRNSNRHNFPSPIVLTEVGEYEFYAIVNKDGVTGRYDYKFMLVEISGVEEGGAYASAAPEWYEPQYFGEVEASLAKDGGSPVPYAKGETINEPGEYVLTVTWRTDSGNSESKSIRFTIEGEGPAAPTIELTGAPNGSYYFSVAPTWTDAEGTTSIATLSKDGAASVEYNKGTLIEEDGEYVLIVTTTKTANGLTAEATITFTIDSRPV